MTTLLSLVEALARDPEEKAAYAAAPDAYLERHGFGELTPAEVNEAVAHSADTLPPPVAAQLQPGDGLDGVAAVDPEAFDPTVGQQYEDDLFGQDDGLDPDDPALHGFEDGGPDGGFEDGPPASTADQAQDGSDGAEGTTDGPDGADGSGRDAATGDDDGIEEAVAEDAAPGRLLADLSDPHGLDIDDASPAAAGGAPLGTEPAGANTAPIEQSAPDGVEGGDAAFETGPNGPDAPLSGPVELIEDPFAGDPLGSAEEPWYQQGPGESFDVEIDEPESDILDDVDDLGYDD